MTFPGTVLEGVSCRPGDRSNRTRIAVWLLATALIGGLITSTLLIRVMVPVLYRWFDEVRVEA